MKRITLLLLVIAATLALGTSTAHAYPPDPPEVSVDDATPAAGGTFTASARCVVPEEVRFTFLDQSATSTCQQNTSALFNGGFAASVAFNGIATATFRVPDTPGTYTVTAQLLTTGITLNSAITVVADPTTPPLPATGGGSATNDLLRLGGGLLAVGLAMSFVAEQRRRRRSRTDVLVG